MRSFIFFFATLFFIFSVPVQGEPTFADLAILLAKGQFKTQVSAGASLEECVTFLNKQGICFSLFDLMDPSRRVKKEDFARVMGQSKLLQLGEAEVVGGCIKSPDEGATWVDYCLLNDVDLKNLWERFLHRTEKNSLPEVERFFGEI